MFQFGNSKNNLSTDSTPTLTLYRTFAAPISLSWLCYPVVSTPCIKGFVPRPEFVAFDRLSASMLDLHPTWHVFTSGYPLDGNLSWRSQWSRNSRHYMYILLMKLHIQVNTAITNEVWLTSTHSDDHITPMALPWWSHLRYRENPIRLPVKRMHNTVKRWKTEEKRSKAMFVNVVEFCLPNS